MGTEETFRDFSIPELTELAATIERDLRGSWADRYIERMEILLKVLEVIQAFQEPLTPESFLDRLKNPHSLEAIKQAALIDSGIARKEISESEYYQDGRVFRDYGKFYNAVFHDGRTQRVREFLQDNLEYPEHTWVGAKEQ